MKKATIILLSTLSFFACSKKNESYTDVTKEYFPLMIGKEVVYDVDSIIWDDFTCEIDTVFHQIRWTVSDTFRDNTNQLIYKINVDIRDNDTATWANNRVYAATATETYLQTDENNLLFIKLVFPVKESYSWEGNTKINTNSSEYQFLFDWNYTYENVGQPFDNGKLRFDNTVIVAEKDETINDPSTASYASRTFSEEVYAKDVGMVYREMTYWTFDENVSSCLNGFQVTMRAVSHN